MCHRKRRTGFRTAPQIYKDKLAQRFPKSPSLIGIKYL
jgi:hypothetical protein